MNVLEGREVGQLVTEAFLPETRQVQCLLQWVDCGQVPILRLMTPCNLVEGNTPLQPGPYVEQIPWLLPIRFLQHVPLVAENFGQVNDLDIPLPVAEIAVRET